MRRTSTGPNTQNNSRMSSGATDRFAAAAGRGLVRIVEHELRGELVGLVVHLGADQEQHGLGIDQDTHALVLDHLVGGLDPLGVFHGVGHAGAAAVLDADAHADDRRYRVRHHVFDALGGGVGETDRLGSRSGCGHFASLLAPGARPGGGLVALK